MSDNKFIQPDREIHPKAQYLPVWVKKAVEINKIVYSPKYDNFIHDSLEVLPRSWKATVDQMYVYAVQYGFPVNCRGLMSNIWSGMCAKERGKRLELVRDEILVPSPTPEHKIAANRLLQRLLFIMTGRDNMLDLVAMRQFFWSVKMNLAGRNTEIDHIMMPVFYGRQETGKTHIISKALTVLGDFWVKADFTVFADDRNLQALDQIPVIFLDEMGKAKETSIENIKKILSKGRHLQRQFHTLDQFNKIESKATLIAATNKPLADIVIDDEMRRFWQIEMAEYEWINHFWDSEIKTMDWRMLWDCVDVDEREPADVVWPLFKKTQSVYARGNHLEDFVRERLEINSEEWHDGNVLYNQYLIWCEYHDITKHLTRNKFSTKIRDHVTSKLSNGTKWNFSIKSFNQTPKPKVDIRQKLLEADGIYDEQDHNE